MMNGRLQAILRHLHANVHPNSVSLLCLRRAYTSASSSSSPSSGNNPAQNTQETVSIGDVTIPLGQSTSELVPVLYNWEDFQSQDVLAVLRWMMQKYSLHQDVFLIGHPGAFRRRLAHWFCEIIQREAEYLAITSETTVVVFLFLSPIYIFVYNLFSTHETHLFSTTFSYIYIYIYF